MGSNNIHHYYYFGFVLELSRSTTIPLVGLQLWLGALVLGDFILDKGRTEFKNKTVLELGTGVGLTSIIAGIFAKEVVSTGKRNSLGIHSILAFNEYFPTIPTFNYSTFTYLSSSSNRYKSEL